MTFHARSFCCHSEIAGKVHLGGGVLRQAIAAIHIGETLLGGFDIGGVVVIVSVRLVAP
ncbi:hypothetical protein [Paraburkholderia sp. J76]|uniref:hypothetical protein n=1 Tax=Paraburkholderia sp. J76 TaxID=2805439 RepID=UPI002ABD8221|nr:hypothetical protein [Paraburkholderia sp. J76]